MTFLFFKMIKTTNQGICPQVIKHGWKGAQLVRWPQQTNLPFSLTILPLPSGKHTKIYGKSPFFMGKSTISTGPCSIVKSHSSPWNPQFPMLPRRVSRPGCFGSFETRACHWATAWTGGITIDKAVILAYSQPHLHHFAGWIPILCVPYVSWSGYIDFIIFIYA